MAKIVEQIILKVTLQDGASKPLKGIDDSAQKTKKSTDKMLDNFKRKMPEVGKGFNKAEMDARAMSKGFDKFGQSINKNMKKSTKSTTLFAKALKLVAAIGIANTLKRIALDGIDVALQFDKINNSLKVTLGSMGAVEAEMEFLTNVTNRLGLETLTAAEAYSKLLASTKGSNLTLKQTREIFEGVASAATAIGLSADDMEGALTAISQMASKGRISLEELTGQLGERIPGALNIAAKAMGMTNKELIKMVESGELMAEELLPKLARALKDEFGAAAEEAAGDSRQADVNRLKNAWNDLLNDMGSGLSKVIPLLTKVIEKTQELGDLATGAVGDAITGLFPDLKAPELPDTTGEATTKLDIMSLKMEQKRAALKEQEVAAQKAITDELARGQGFRDLTKLAAFADTMMEIRNGAELTKEQFSKISGFVAAQLKDGKQAAVVLENVKKFASGEDGKGFLGKGIGEKGVMDAVLDALDEIDDMLKDDVLKSFDKLINKGEQFKKTFNLAKQIGLSKSEFEQIGGLIDQARRAGLSPEQIKARVEELRREGVLGKGKEGQDPILGGGTTKISGQQEQTAFLQGLKIETKILLAAEEQVNKIDELIDVVRDQGTIGITL